MEDLLLQGLIALSATIAGALAFGFKKLLEKVGELEGKLEEKVAETETQLDDVALKILQDAIAKTKEDKDAE